MGLISSFLKKIFGTGRQQNNQGLTISDADIRKWKKEDEERLILVENQVKDWLTEYLKANGDIKFSWESGNDEGFVTFENGVSEDEDNFEDLEDYITTKLEIPSAGEFQMTGKGTIYLENNSVKAKYSSIFKTTIDFDEETEEEIFSEDEHDSGDVVLYKF